MNGGIAPHENNGIAGSFKLKTASPQILLLSGRHLSEARHKEINILTDRIPPIDSILSGGISLF
jgi:hypothetical protein